MKKLTFIIALLFCSVLFGQDNLKNKLFNGIVYGKDTIVMVKSNGNNIRVTTNNKTTLYKAITTPVTKFIDGEEAIIYKLCNGFIIVKENEIVITTKTNQK